jgi:His-Xaa-Ser system radical SAM maturase HxsC
VVRLVEGQRKVTVCFRASDRHHTLFVTNQCNSRCLMCSQPPTPQEDEWLFDEAMEIVALVEEAPTVIGISGGEPTLHPQRLRALLDVIHSRWPSTQVEVLTNARRLGDEGSAGLLLDGLAVGRTTWLVPLYGASDEVHDFVVQSPGAFDETIAGLLHLQQHGQCIQLRTVLVRPVIDDLAAWAEFVVRNLPFIDAVALMATEPIGFALANQDISVIDVGQCVNELVAATAMLVAHQMRPVLMNMPLCKLPERLRSLAAVSISDWKNAYAPECADCTLRSSCAGFFVGDKTSVYRTGLKPVRPVLPATSLQGGLHV